MKFTVFKSKLRSQLSLVAIAGAQVVQGKEVFATTGAETMKVKVGGYASSIGFNAANNDLIFIVGKFINIILGLVGVVLFVLILAAGGIWMTAAGNEEQVKKAQRIIKRAVMGVVVIVLAFALSNFVITLLTSSGALS